MKNSFFAIIAFLGILFFSNNTSNAQSSDCCKDKSTACCTEKGACCTSGESGSQAKDCCNDKNSSCCIDQACCTSGESGSNAENTKTDAVTGETIPEGKAVEFSYMGKSYYFAKEENLAKFKAEPIDYVKDMACPIMGDAASKETAVEHNGTKYYLCCEMCVKKFNKNPEKYMNGSK